MSDTPSSKAIYLRLLSYVRNYWKIFALSLVGMMLLGMTEPLLPALMKPMVDESFVEKNRETIWLWPMMLVGLVMFRGIFSYVSTMALHWVANKVVLDLRKEMFESVMLQPVGSVERLSTGKLISKFIYDASQVTTASTEVLVILIRDSFAVIGLLLYMAYVDWKLTLFFFLIIPFISVFLKVVSRRMRRLNHDAQNAMGELTASLEETISAIKDIKIFGGQQFEKQRFRQTANWVRRYLMKIAASTALSVPVVQLLTTIALAIIVYFASLKSLENQMTVGEFVSFLSAMGMLFSPVKRLTRINEPLQRGLACATSVFALIDTPLEKNDGKLVLGDTVKGELVFKDVDFRYDDSENLVLQNVNITIQPGETVALVGKSGSGKTSLLNLIPRFYTPDSGSILLDGKDIRDITLASLRQQIAAVSQHVKLFDDTVAANIAYAQDSESNVKKIEDAAKAAAAWSFIEAMPKGVHSGVGPGGSRLSGGQQQRLAIARAIFKDAPILLLDEATSALDTESEREFFDALERLQHGRTTLIIAHRLSTVRNADRILVMDEGKIVEAGNHDQLLNQKGIYAKLYNLQFAGQ